MRHLALLVLVTCSSGPTEDERECRRDRVSVVEQLDLADGVFGRLAIEQLPEPDDEVDNDLGRILSADSKVMVEVYRKRRDLIPGLREAVRRASEAWNGVGDPSAATTALADKLAVFDKVMDPLEERFKLSKTEGAALIASLEAKRSDPRELKSRLDREIKMVVTHNKFADLWLSSRALDLTSFAPLRRSIERAKTSCAKR